MGLGTNTVHVGADALVRPDIYVISAPPLPGSWTGKNNAMTAGAKIAKGNWLLFTDADTVHKPGSLARAVAEAEQHGAALLSYSPEQEVHGFWEKAVMPVIFAELAKTYPPAKVNDPASPIAAANGQYLLISREAYDAVGGHTQIASNLLEDVAMARLVKSSGRKIFFRYGGDAVRTRMYRSFAQMREGWTKNLALLFKDPVRMAAHYLIESFVLLGVVSGVIQIALLGPPNVPSQSVVLPHYPISDRYFPLLKWWLGGVLFLFVYLLSRSIWRVMKAHFPPRLSVTSMLGPPVFAYLLLRSRHFCKRGLVDWKERAYVYSAEEIEGLKKPHVRAI
jgi:glycosyltransferase involved in cell wall biosynthesis